MSPLRSFSTGQGAHSRQSHRPPISGTKLQVQAATTTLPAYPFQPLPPPNGPAPYHFDLSQLLTADVIQQINDAGVMVFQAVGDTGDYRGQQQDFVAAMMTLRTRKTCQPTTSLHFSIISETLFILRATSFGIRIIFMQPKGLRIIVAIPGNHDCQPDDPSDGPGDPNKTPLDGWVQNFMANDPSQPGTNKTGTSRTQMDLPNVYWTFTTPFATIIGLFSNVGEGTKFIKDQIDWFQKELTAADESCSDSDGASPAISGDDEHSGSSAVGQVLTNAFKATGRYPNLVLSRGTSTIISGLPAWCKDRRDSCRFPT